MESHQEDIIVDYQNRGRNDFMKVGLGYFSLLVVTMVLQRGMVAIVGSLSISLPAWSLVIISMLPLYLVATPICIAIIKKIPVQEQLPKEKWGIGKLLLYFMVAVGMMYLGNIVSQIVVSLVNGILGITMINPVENLVMNSGMIVNIAIVVIIAPIIEELLFRKVLLDRIRGYGEGTAVLISGLTFALFHGNLFQVLYAFLLGCVFAYIYLKTNQIKYCIGFHMVINFMGSVVSVLLVKGVDMEALGSGDVQAVMQILPRLLPMIGYGLLMIGCMIASVVVLICLRKKITFRAGTYALPAGKRFTMIFLNVGMILYFIGCGFLFYTNI